MTDVNVLSVTVRLIEIVFYNSSPKTAIFCYLKYFSIFNPLPFYCFIVFMIMITIYYLVIIGLLASFGIYKY